MSRLFPRLAALAAIGLLAATAFAQELRRTPLPADHPLLGVWRIELPSAHCYEVYHLRADGTSRVTSGQERAESEFQISLRPSANGFYRWVDKVVSDNGQPDCMGSVTEVGHVVTNFILLHPSGREFLMCEQEDLDSCIGPFVLQESI